MGHSFSTFAKFSGKLAFLTHMYVYREYQGGKKCWFFGKVCKRTT